MRLLSTLVTAALAVALSAPAAVPAQGTDPDADSPSGVVYEIPLDSARGDAAPPLGGGDDGAAGGAQSAPAPAPASAATSSIHSENGFGSSSQVPGAAKQDRKVGRAGDEQVAGGVASAGDAARSSGAATERLITAADTGPAPSTDRAYLLIALAFAAAAGLGLAARQALRKR